MNRAGIVKLVLIWTAVPRVRDCRFRKASLLAVERSKVMPRRGAFALALAEGAFDHEETPAAAGLPRKSGSPARAGPQSMS